MPVHAVTQMSVDATSASTCGPWIPFNLYNSPFNVSFGGVIVSGGPATWAVHHTFDNVLLANASALPIRSFVHADVTAAGTAQDGNYAFPVHAARLVVTGVTSAATVHIDFLQSGS